ncbi:MAG: hypothetical protein ACYCTY_10755 [Sulfuricella sp.]
MSNKLISTRSDIAAPIKIASLFLDSRSTNVAPSFLKSGFQSVDLQSEMSSAAFSNATIQLTKQVESLKSPLSPASFSFAPSEKAIEERLFDATSSVKILTAQVAMHMDKKWRDKLFSQIDSLHDLDEWDADDNPIKQSSFATFLKAILFIKPQRHPGLGLSYEGYLIAAWTTGQDRLTTEFLPNDRVCWVLTRNVGGEVERAAGQTVVSRLYDCLIPYSPDHWFLHEKN